MEASRQGTAALLTDLKQHVLLDETLMLWGGEFGRVPIREGSQCRDHNHYGFTVWMAGGGMKGGFSQGGTDNFGMHAVQRRTHVPDLPATIRHRLGIDHPRLTYHYSGRDFRLNEMHGGVNHEIIVDRPPSTRAALARSENFPCAGKKSCVILLNPYYCCAVGVCQRVGIAREVPDATRNHGTSPIA